ncbi:ribonuclease H-like domain-containing protein [Tanacetum coccineum]
MGLSPQAKLDNMNNKVKLEESEASDKSSDSETTDFASCVTSVQTSSSKTTRTLVASSLAFLLVGIILLLEHAPGPKRAIIFQQFSRPVSYKTQMDMEGQSSKQIKILVIVDSGLSRSMTDKECLVLSKEFQPPDSSQVVLRVPRRHNLYCFNLTNIHSEREIQCLLAKASLDESTRWHRRMAHVNFKNMNKLAKHGLVNGLPLKLFTNEHNCVACNKGKQHKASYKAITAVITISEPLQLLHMDLFGPTSIRSIDHKSYSLVVTDDFSRVLVTRPHNKTPYELLSGKVPNVSHLKPFGCHVTILNTSDHLGKFEGKADEGFLVGYSAHSKAYRGLGHEWYFNLDNLTDSLGYTRFKSNQPAGTQDTNTHAGPKVHTASATVESTSDYAEELAMASRTKHMNHFCKQKDTWKTA